MDVTELATVATAAFAAIAAGASWRSVAQSRRAWQWSQRPDLAISLILDLGTDRLKIHVANHGGGTARRVRFVVIDEGQVARGDLPPNAMLQGGEERTLATDIKSSPETNGIAVVICQDGEGRTHAWDVTGKRIEWRVPGPGRRRLSDERVLHNFYPDADPLGSATTPARYTVER